MKSIPALLILLLLAASCAVPGPIPQAHPTGSIAVAGFTSPRYNWELMAGYLPLENMPVDQEVMDKLDQIMMDLLRAHKVEGIIPPGVTRQCQEIVVFQHIGEGRESAFKYWTSVGECLPADYLVVPQAVSWREREGGEYGATVPAGVILDMYLVNVKEKRIEARYRYDKTQTPLSANLLKAGEFMQDGGKWLTAYQLARKGMDFGLKELGL